MKYSIVSALSFAIFAAAKDVMVDVGEDGLTFDPASISCSSGDRVIFTIYPGGHSVVSSDATHPCAADMKISSGDIDPKASNNGNKFTIDCPSATTYLFCAAPEHCKLGMVAVINGNSDQLTTYKNMAKNGPNAGTPPSVAGGVAGPVSPASGGSSSGGSNGGGGESSSMEAPPPKMSATPAMAPPPAESSAEAPAESSEEAPSTEAAAPPMSSAPAAGCPVYDYNCKSAAAETTEAPMMSSAEAAPAQASTMSMIYTPMGGANPTYPAPASGSAAPAASTAAGTAAAAPAATNAPAATGGASSSFASFGAAVFAAVIALF